MQINDVSKSPLVQFERRSMFALRSLLQRHLDQMPITASALDPTDLITDQMISEFTDLAALLWNDFGILADGLGLDTLPWGTYSSLIEDAISSARNGYINSIKAALSSSASRNADILGEFYFVQDYVPGTGLKPPAPYEVQFGDIRDVLGRLGGSAPHGEAPLSTGMAGGAVFSQVLEDNGISTNDKLWVYGEASRREFNGHLQMDGLVFKLWDDPALEISPQDRWLRTSHYRPGDHWGCCCLVVPYIPNFGSAFSTVIEPQVTASAEEFETIEFACRDASCRPPTSGGTGGSKSSGGTAADTRESQIRSNQILDETIYKPTGGLSVQESAKHFGSLAVAKEMTPDESRSIRQALDYVTENDQTSSTEIFAQITAMGRSNVIDISGATVGIYAQLNGIGDRYIDDYKMMDRISDISNEFLSRGDGQLRPQDRQEFTDTLQSLTGVSVESGFVSYLNMKWASSSHSEESVAVQMILADKFNLAPASASIKKFMGGSTEWDTARSLAKAPAIRRAIESAASASYRVTQRHLRDRNVESLTVVRGVAIKGDPAKIIAQPSPLSSWTTSTKTAKLFGGAIFRATVPADQVFSLSNLSGHGSFDENEVILLGRPTTASRLNHDQESETFAVGDEVEVEIDLEDFDWMKAPSYETIEFACHDKSCAPPPVGAGGSSTGKASLTSDWSEEKKLMDRGPRPSIFTGSASPWHEIGVTTTDIVNGFESFKGPNGETAEVTKVLAPFNGTARITGKILDSDGKEIGHFERQYNKSRRDNEFTVHHRSLDLEPEAQGKGIGGAFLRHTADQYRSQGVEAITVTAVNGVDPQSGKKYNGAYTWGKLGFELRPGRDNNDRWKITASKVVGKEVEKIQDVLDSEKGVAWLKDDTDAIWEGVMTL